MSLKFSIIVPIYNASQYLRECLDSLVGQSFADWEAVCVDDGSTDGSTAILDRYAAKDPRFVVIHKENEGVSVARNVAMAYARGEWLLFADADDAYVPGAFAALEKLISEYDFDGGFCSTFIPFKDSIPHVVAGSGAVQYLSDEPENGKNLLFMPRRLLGYPWLRFFRAATFKDVTFPVGVPMCEDMLQLLRCLERKVRWARFDLQVYVYRDTPGSASKVSSALWCANTLEVYLQIMREASERLNMSDSESRAYARQSSFAIKHYVRCAFKTPFDAAIGRVVSASHGYMRVVGASALDWGVRMRLWCYDQRCSAGAYQLIAAFDWFYFRFNYYFRKLLGK